MKHVVRRTMTVSAALAATLALVSPGPASAHADVTANFPRDGQVLAASSARTTVYVDFNELVSISSSSLRVRNSAGSVLTSAATIRTLPSTDPDLTPSRVAARTAKPLPRGRYALEYSVVSQDGHRVVRAFGFGVGISTSASRPIGVAVARVSTTQPNIRVVLSRAQVGARSVSVRMPAGTTGGTVTWTCQRVAGRAPKVSAPFIWPLGRTVAGYAVARGYIPTPCRYTISVVLDRPFPQYSLAWRTPAGVTMAP